MIKFNVTCCKDCPFAVQDFYSYCNLTAKDSTPTEITNLNIIPEFCELSVNNEITVSINKEVNIDSE